MTEAERRQRVAEALREIRELPSRDTPSLRGVRRRLSRGLKKASASDVRAVAQGLIRAGYRWVGYELIHEHPSALGSLGLRDVEALGRDIDSWDRVDTFAGYIAGPAWRAGQISDAAIHRWARSSDRWWRRAAVVATTALNVESRGGYGDPARTLAVCTLVVDDRDDMVEKALSWALRVLVPWAPDAVEGFLGDHDAVLGARVRREVRNKLTTGLKNPRSRSRRFRPRM